MKNLYTKILVITGFILSLISCKAQQLYPLNTDFETLANYSYIKDLNNELDPYVGIYKTAFQGNEITLYITKENNKLEERTKKTFYRDALVIKYIVKNSSGQILQDTQNMNIPEIELYSTGTWPAKNKVEFFYSGTYCHIGWGGIDLKKINATQISWNYTQEESITDDCPTGTDTTVYLPKVDNLIFTKQ